MDHVEEWWRENGHAPVVNRDNEPTGYVASDYRNAPSGDGPLAAEWRNKPHRLVYDLAAAVAAQHEYIVRLVNEIDRLRGRR